MNKFVTLTMLFLFIFVASAIAQEKEDGPKWMSPSDWLYVRQNGLSIETAYGDFTFDSLKNTMTMSKDGKELGVLEFGIIDKYISFHYSEIVCSEDACNLTMVYRDSNVVFRFDKFRVKIDYIYTNKELTKYSPQFFFEMKTDSNLLSTSNDVSKFENEMIFDISDITSQEFKEESDITETKEITDGLIRIETKPLELDVGESITIDPSWESPTAIIDFCGEEGFGGDVSHVIDGNTGTEWAHGTYHEHWIIFDTGSTQTISDLRVQIGDPDHSFYEVPCKFTGIYVCDDAACSGESTLGTCGTWTGSAGTRDCDITDTGGRYIKVTINTYGGPCGTVNMEDFYEFWYAVSAGSADGIACSVDGDCTSSNCVEAIDEAVDYCAPAGKECSRDGYAAGYDTADTYDAGVTTYICISDDGGGAPCSDAGTQNCDEYAAYYCNSGSWVSGSSDELDLGCTLCKWCSGTAANSEGDLACENADADTDVGTDCLASYDACDNPYTRRGPDGFCDGAGACDTNDATLCVAAGYVCSNGDLNNPGSGNYCDIWADCIDSNTEADQYYVGYTNDCSGNCDDSQWQDASRTWNATEGYQINETEHALVCSEEEIAAGRCECPGVGENFDITDCDIDEDCNIGSGVASINASGRANITATLSCDTTSFNTLPADAYIYLSATAWINNTG